MASEVPSAISRPQPYRYHSGHSYVAAMEAYDQHLLPDRSGVPHTPKRLSRYSQEALAAYVPNTKWTMCLAAVLCAQCAICIALETLIIAMWAPPHTEPDVGTGNRLLFAQAATVMFESVYQLFLGLDAIRYRNAVQMIGLCLNNTAMLILAVTASAAISALVHDNFDFGFDTKFWVQTCGPFIVMVVLLALATATLSFMTRKLYGDFAWQYTGTSPQRTYS